jgi:hypothetical protein
VEDVSADPRYLACSLETRLEIVIPIRANGKIVGEIDIDSHTRNAFGSADRSFLEEYAAALGVSRRVRSFCGPKSLPKTADTTGLADRSGSTWRGQTSPSLRPSICPVPFSSQTDRQLLRNVTGAPFTQHRGLLITLVTRWVPALVHRRHARGRHSIDNQQVRGLHQSRLSICYSLPLRLTRRTSGIGTRTAYDPNG